MPITMPAVYCTTEQACVTLRKSSVLESWFNHLDGVVLQVKVDLDRAHAVLLFAFLVHAFFEIRVVSKYLPVWTGWW